MHKVINEGPKGKEGLVEMNHDGDELYVPGARTPFSLVFL